MIITEGIAETYYLSNSGTALTLCLPTGSDQWQPAGRDLKFHNY